MSEEVKEVLEQTEQSEQQPEEGKKGKKKKEKKVKGEKKKKEPKPKKLKTDINLIVNKNAEANRRALKALPYFLAFMALFIGLGVIWPLSRIHKAAVIYGEKKKELAVLQEAISDYDKVLDEYNDLFGIFMSPAERNNTHRVEIIDMLNDDLIYDIPIKGFRVTDNSITVNTDATDLETVQERLRILKEDERNQYAAFTTATIKDEKKGEELVATFRIVFKTNNNAKVEMKEVEAEPVENNQSSEANEGGN